MFLLDDELLIPVNSPAATVLEAVLASGVNLNHSCGGMGSCGTCRILVESPVGELCGRNELEQEMAQSRGFLDQERLACQLTAIPGLKFRRAGSN